MAEADQVYVLSATLVGLLGAVYGYSLGYFTTPSVFRLDFSLNMIVFALIGFDIDLGVILHAAADHLDLGGELYAAAMPFEKVVGFAFAWVAKRYGRIVDRVVGDWSIAVGTGRNVEDRQPLSARALQRREDIASVLFQVGCELFGGDAPVLFQTRYYFVEGVVFGGCR